MRRTIGAAAAHICLVSYKQHLVLHFRCPSILSSSCFRYRFLAFSFINLGYFQALRMLNCGVNECNLSFSTVYVCHIHIKSNLESSDDHLCSYLLSSSKSYNEKKTGCCCCCSCSCHCCCSVKPSRSEILNMRKVPLFCGLHGLLLVL